MADSSFKTGVVKEVPSGDTMVIMGTNWSNGPPPTKTVCLAGLVTPRCGRRDAKDEPFAFQAREFLRKKVIGQTVQFRVDYVVPGGTRELGVVMLGNENLAESVVSAGWAKLRERKGGEEDPLVQLAASAESEQLGMWSQEPGAAAASVRDVTDGVEDAQGVKERAGGAELDAVVEYVMAADRMRILLGPPYHLITFNLSGIKAPNIRRDETGAETAEPHAREAKFLVERTMLNRDVKVKLEGVDKFNNFYGSMCCDGSNLAETLLTQGMAKCVEWSLKFAADPLALRTAERGAKAARLRVFKNYVAPGEGPNAMKQDAFSAVVSEVRSGDTLNITTEDGRTETVTLSSVRAPKLGNARREVAYEPWSWESREAVRAYVGKTCMVKLEYKRVLPAGEDDDRPAKTLIHGTVMVASKGGAFDSNLAERLCEAGLVSVIQHREDDDRSAFYDDLLTAESKAQKTGKGMHGPAAPTPRRFNDLTNQDPARASARLSSLVRLGKLKAVVEYCYNGGRFKLFIPKEDTFLNFVVGSVNCPSTAGRDRSAEPFGEEALDFAKNLLLQRDVHIEIETCNRGGTFIGALYYEKKKSYALSLLAEGYGYIQGYQASDDLVKAEAVAKDAKLKVWENWVDEDEASAAEEGADEAGFLEVEVSEIVAAGHFFVQRRGDKGLSWATEQLAGMDVGATPELSELPAKGALICAKWCGDWYRAKVMGLTKVTPELTLVRVRFVDYGNVDALPLSELRAMDASLSRTSALATECKLACINCPCEEADFAEEAGVFFRELVWGKQLVAKVEYRESGVLQVTLFDQANSADLTINSAMLREGLGRVNSKLGKKPQVAELVTKLALDEAVGKKERLNLWQYGDAYDEDEAPEFGYKPRV